MAAGQQSTTTSNLFKSLTLGSHQLSHRLIFAPLTRFRSSDTHVPLPFVAEYYAQRACVPATFLISEATIISPRASGFANVPGIWNSEQISGWKEVTQAVHEKGGIIFCQLWALGRAAQPEVLLQEWGGKVKLSSSCAVALPVRKGGQMGPTPKQISGDEVRLYIAEYAQAARNAIEAGFDGVEIHGANGYLVDQFTQDVVNTRTDEWGGSIEKRARFALEVAKACVDAIGPQKVGIRLSPWSTFQGMGMKEPIPQFAYIVRRLKELGLAYVHFVESRISGPSDVKIKGTNEDYWATGNNDELVKIWQEDGNERPVFLAGGFKPDTAMRCVDKQYPDANVGIVFGRFWISNPDLAFRIRRGIPLQDYNRKTFYTKQSRVGYTDYTFSKDFSEAQAKL